MSRRATAVGTSSAAASTTGESPAHENSIILVGTMASTALDRELPSGDVLATWRMVVRRPPPNRRPPDGARVTSIDTIDCASWRADVRRAVAGWSEGDLVRIEGSLRRRFWRSASGTASRCEVEVMKARRVSRAEP
jgi:single-strand DNA-binding protein